MRSLSSLRGAAVLFALSSFLMVEGVTAKNNNSTTPRACLAMIMKNEGPILPRLFESIKGFVSEYCVMDTGSTDDTVEVLKGIDMPGKGVSLCVCVCVCNCLSVCLVCLSLLYIHTHTHTHTHTQECLPFPSFPPHNSHHTRTHIHAHIKALMHQ
jgi:hypothetical protein